VCSSTRWQRRWLCTHHRPTKTLAAILSHRWLHQTFRRHGAPLFWKEHSQLLTQHHFICTAHALSLSSLGICSAVGLSHEVVFCSCPGSPFWAQVPQVTFGFCTPCHWLQAAAHSLVSCPFTLRGLLLRAAEQHWRLFGWLAVDREIKKSHEAMVSWHCAHSRFVWC